MFCRGSHSLHTTQRLDFIKVQIKTGFAFIDITSDNPNKNIQIKMKFDPRKKEASTRFPERHTTCSPSRPH
jgi:hypothetical protein